MEKEYSEIDSKAAIQRQVGVVLLRLINAGSIPSHIVSTLLYSSPRNLFAIFEAINNCLDIKNKTLKQQEEKIEILLIKYFKEVAVRHFSLSNMVETSANIHQGSQQAQTISYTSIISYSKINGSLAYKAQQPSEFLYRNK